MNSPARKRCLGRRVLILAAAAGLLVMIIIAVRSLNSEPTYNGRPLRAWLRELPRTTFLLGSPLEPPLAARLGRPRRPTQVTEAQEALRSMGAESFPFLLDRFTAKDPPVKAQFIAWLRRHRWLESKLEPAALKRERAMFALVSLKGHVELPVEQWAALLASPDPEIRRQSLELFWHWESADDAVVQGAIRCLSDSNPGVAWWAAYTLQGIDPDAEKLAKFVVTLEAELAAGLEPVIGAWTTRLSYSGLRHWADRVFVVLGPRAKSAVPRLISLLETESGAVRAGISRALGAIGPDAKPALPLLLTGLTDSNHDFRVAAAQALGPIGGLDHWIDLLSSGSSTEQESAAVVLGYMGERAEHAVPALIRTLQNEQMEVRAAAAVALGRIGARAEPAVPALEQALQDSDPWVRQKAAVALRKLTNTPGLRE